MAVKYLHAWAALAFCLAAVSAGAEDCDGECTIYGGPIAFVWLPLSETDNPNVSGDIMTATMTVKTIIDKALDETSTITEWPSGTIQASINEDGKAVYTINNEDYSKVMTYPDIYLEWGDNYEWSGELYTTDGDSDASTCATLNSKSSTVPITWQPQPTTPSERKQVYKRLGIEDPSNSTDSSGLSHIPLIVNPDTYRAWMFNDFAPSWFPDDAPPTSCEPVPGGPHLGGFQSTYWKTKSTTAYVTGSITKSGKGVEVTTRSTAKDESQTQTEDTASDTEDSTRTTAKGETQTRTANPVSDTGKSEDPEPDKSDAPPAKSAGKEADSTSESIKVAESSVSSRVSSSNTAETAPADTLPEKEGLATRGTQYSSCIINTLAVVLAMFVLV